MADSTVLLVGGAAVLGVGYLLWKKSQDQAAPAAPAAPPPNTLGYSIPSDAGSQIAAQLKLRGLSLSTDSSSFVAAASAVVPLPTPVLQNVWVQWNGYVASRGGATPGDTQVTNWIQQAIGNYG